MVSSSHPARGRCVPISSAAERPSLVSDARRNATRFAERRRRQVDAAQQFAGPQHVGVVAGDEIDRGDLARRRRRAATACSVPRAPPPARSSAPAGSDMQMLPPTVAAFQILNDASKELQHSRNSGAAVHSPGAGKWYSSAIRQVAAMSSPSADASSAGQPSPSRSISVSMAGCGSENSQVPPASHASPSCQRRDVGRRSGVADRGDGVEVHLSRLRSRLRKIGKRGRARARRDQGGPLVRAERHRRRQERLHLALRAVGGDRRARVPPISS